MCLDRQDLQRQTGAREGSLLQHWGLFEWSGRTVLCLFDSSLQSRLFRLFFFFFSHSLEKYFVCVPVLFQVLISAQRDAAGNQKDRHSVLIEPVFQWRALESYIIRKICLMSDVTEKHWERARQYDGRGCHDAGDESRAGGLSWFLCRIYTEIQGQVRLAPKGICGGKAVCWWRKERMEVLPEICRD